MGKQYYYFMKGNRIAIDPYLHRELKKLTNKEHYQYVKICKCTVPYEACLEEFSTHESAEQQALYALEKEKLYGSLCQLEREDAKLITALYFYAFSERQLAKKIGVTQKTINKRKHRILQQLRNFLEN